MKKAAFFLLISFFTVLIAACARSTQHVPDLTAAQAQQLYNPRGNSILGNPDGNVTVVEFFDYQCPYCRRTAPILQQLVQDNADVRVVFKEFLLFGPSSELATRAALAAQKQGKYLEMHNALLTAPSPLSIDDIMKIAEQLHMNTKQLKADMGSASVNQQIQENTDLVETLNLQGAPTFIIANTAIIKNPQATNKNQQIMLNGMVTLDKLKQYITQVSH